MRDWLAIPMSSPTMKSSNSSGIDYITTDDEEHSYDMISNKATTTEEEDEEEIEISGDENDESEISSWLSILNVFSKKLKTSSSKSSKSLSSNSSISESTTNNQLNNKIIFKETTAIDYYIEEEIPSSSHSSIMSSTDTDHSTPANSEIIANINNESNQSNKYYDNVTLTNVKIYWNHGGKKVQITGEFDNWSASVDMIMDTENNSRHVIEILMDLSKDIEYKFIVDGEWKYAADLPHRTDWRGNVNNVVYKL